MNNQVKSCAVSGEHDTAAFVYPLRNWWDPSRRFNDQASGLLPLLDLGSPQRTDWLEGSQWPCTGQGTVPCPTSRGPCTIPTPGWSGGVQMEGRHEERPDLHGFVARCFTRKYRLPAETDVTKIVSVLSVDGILTVEAPVPKPSVPTTIIIPIKVEEEASEGQQEAENSPFPDKSKAAEVHEESSANGEKQDEGKREEDGSENAASRDQEGVESHEDVQEKKTEEKTSPSEEGKSCEISQEIL
ncbi:hypothetical protein WMY93_004404 [Mugilogobius chulae]|uniref:SHSP domain-containing protein n=1 Tax=Mugilogobius chulae TaxID=88201 RepID=A0AAW0PZR7_9GOBI